MVPDCQFWQSNTYFFGFLPLFIWELKHRDFAIQIKTLLTCTHCRINCGLGARRVINNAGMAAELMEAEHEAREDLRQFAQPLNHRTVF